MVQYTNVSEMDLSHHLSSGMTQYPVFPLAMCGLAQEDFIEHNKL
jgi:hypothetical protein